MDKLHSIKGLHDVNNNYNIMLECIKRDYNVTTKDVNFFKNKNASICNYNTFNELYIPDKKDLIKISNYMSESIKIKLLSNGLKKCDSFKDLMATLEKEIGISGSTMTILMRPITVKINKYCRLSQLGMYIENIYLDAEELDEINIRSLPCFESKDIKLNIDKKCLLKYVRNIIIDMFLITNECKIDYEYELNDESDRLIYVERKLVYYEFKQDGNNPTINGVFGIKQDTISTDDETKIVTPLYFINNSKMINDMRDIISKKDIIGKDIIYIQDDGYIKAGEYYQGIVFLLTNVNTSSISESIILEKMYS